MISQRTSNFVRSYSEQIESISLIMKYKAIVSQIQHQLVVYILSMQFQSIKTKLYLAVRYTQCIQFRRAQAYLVNLNSAIRKEKTYFSFTKGFVESLSKIWGKMKHFVVLVAVAAVELPFFSFSLHSESQRPPFTRHQS